MRVIRRDRITRVLQRGRAVSRFLSPHGTPGEYAQDPLTVGEFHFQTFQMFRDDPCYCEVPEPLVVGRYDEPRRLLGTTARQGVFVRSRVVVPELALLVVSLADLPSLGRIIKPLLEATQLLLFGNVQVELEDVSVTLDELLLERIDLVIAAGPDRFRDQIVDTDYEHVLVLGAIENGCITCITTSAAFTRRFALLLRRRRDWPIMFERSKNCLHS